MLLRPDPAEGQPRVGALCVPRFGESPAVEAGLRGSLAASRADAERAGLVYTEAEGPQADEAALIGILETSDLCTLLCHGLIDAGRSSVSLLLAAEGRLPLGDAIAAARSGLPHRLDWRTGTRTKPPPRVISS